MEIKTVAPKFQLPNGAQIEHRRADLRFTGTGTCSFLLVLFVTYLENIHSYIENKQKQLLTTNRELKVKNKNF